MSNPVYISDHVTYREVVNSQVAKKHGIPNSPTEDQLENITTLMHEVFEPLRELGGNKPIHISSCFRSSTLNAFLDGSGTSQHMANYGAAMDLDNDPYPNRTPNDQLFWDIYNFLDFDQLIWEAGTDQKPGWVHVSFVSKELNRNEVLRYVPGKGYKPFKA